ncbi:hypothetical protein DL770_007909 [Monosporascus sp. CRB-9-2]|nr:hypothetical protein DL770_007909 [Monosporascus sp. CRB-9-2]
MASPVLPSTSNFLGVALVVNRSRDGPQFVFHYPPRILPTSNPPQGAKSTDRPDGENGGGGPSGSEGGDDDDDEGDDDSGSDDDNASGDVANEGVLLNKMYDPAFEAQPGALRDSTDFQNWNHDDHLETEGGSHIVPWDHVAGFPTRDLESLLTPARPFHKKRFQVSLDQLLCASYPVFVPENGMWKKKKKQKKPKYQHAKPSENGDAASRSDYYTASQQDTAQIEARDMGDDATNVNPTDEAEDKKSGMTMFNLVFILHPKKHEARELIDTLYFHIIKKVNKAYKYSQQRCDFVWKESKRILALKDKGREARTKMSVLWRDILETSSLAASMQDIYEAVSQNRIASLQLETTEGAVTHSVQIPAPFCLTDLPADDDAGSRGLWITTANSFVAEDNMDDPGFLDKNFALLLVNDEKKIIAELQADSDDTTAAMVEFVRLSKPTLSFHQLGHGNALSPAQVRKYAHHFIFWRRAIAIPPLHARDVYIMSPNCNTDDLPRASQTWAKAFPLAPHLPNFLADLSMAPRPYKWHSPSKNHRPTYLSMLAWLMRGGWVTQLCTFAYVVVWPEILYEVEYQLEADELRVAHEASVSPFASSTVLPATAPDEDGGGRRRATSLSPAESSSDDHSSSLSESQHTTIGEQVAEKARLERIADKANREAAEKAATHARKQIPIATDHPSLNDAAHLANLAPYIIVDSKKATGNDSLYLSAIGRRFKDPKVQKAWPVFWKYFNGRSALERIALQEDMKRKEAWNLLTAMSEYLLCVRHW